eukprot:262268-Heterocapsa_arctica.AAC.1
MEGHARMERRTITRNGKGHHGEKGEEEQEHQEEAGLKNMRSHTMVKGKRHGVKHNSTHEQLEQELLEEHGKELTHDRQ